MQNSATISCNILLYCDTEEVYIDTPKMCVVASLIYTYLYMDIYIPIYGYIHTYIWLYTYINTR